MSQALDAAFEDLHEHGYVVVEGVLSPGELNELREVVDSTFDCERATPFDPGESPAAAEDVAIEEFLRASYTVSDAELARLMRRIRRSRATNLKTPWPVDPSEINKCFLHLPTLFDQDRSQRVWNLLAKGEVFARLIEHPAILPLVRRVLGADCVLSDCSATSIGAQTGGGAWHVDVPLGQLSEPLPDFPLTMQNIFMLDDFTPQNGATRVVPKSHKRRTKPTWTESDQENEVILTAPAGSVAVWLSNTWHRSGPNETNTPRRGVICYYSRSWIKPFNDFRAGVPAKIAERFSPTVRYLMGFGSNAIVRG
ncbi:MAG: phytanoyl-CoA dioxygenase family protein [Planctomycetes bacterium]|nr:phytanoyl-CoA dioxygenase family protein [Planctomycetota bacterium]